MWWSKLNTVKPGRTIDGLKEDIRKSTKLNRQIEQAIQDTIEHIANRKAQTKDYGEREVKAKSDWMELFRDMATFELNYSHLNK